MAEETAATMPQAVGRNEAAAGGAALTPSQALTTAPSSNNNRNNRRRRAKGRRIQEHENGDEKSQGTAPGQRKEDKKPPPGGDGQNPRSRPRRKPANRNKPQQNSNDGSSENQQPRRKNNNSRRRRARGPRKTYPWRRFLPKSAVDPITLDSLASLPYPPFAIVGSKPYVPVGEWPVPEQDDKDVSEDAKQGETEEERQQRVLREQWGEAIVKTEAEVPSAEEAHPPGKRYYHLYDGRALAYYLVSQLQFIDPLNRRDLTRDELVNLDNYLQRHGYSDINVTEAYDAKGITLSTAGSAAQTASGRAEIMQQEARALLNALFGSRDAVLSPPAQQRQPNPLREQYAEYERTQHAENHQDITVVAASHEMYGSVGGGLLIIDDDENPGLRSGLFPDSAPAAVLERMQQQREPAREQVFPALPAPTSPKESQKQQKQSQQLPAKPPGPSKTLQRITKSVKKTSPEEAQRQWEAREEARKKAMLSNLSYGMNPVGIDWDGEKSLPRSIAVPSSGPTDGQLERNRAFAEAVGIVPRTIRQNINSGWSRPVEPRIELDEFNNELNAANYPDSLILKARERMTQLLKLEKRWKTFLSDDTAASLPLNPMDKQMRTFVHEYSDFWKLRTESFDPEPKRYIHCVKMMDTSAPYPLLSEAARNWRGPRPLLSSLHQVQGAVDSGPDHTSQQIAGQSTNGAREIPPPPERVPLPLKPRSVGPYVAVEAPPGAMFDIQEDALKYKKPEGKPYADQQINARSEALFTGRERPKLELAKRTIPIPPGLPPYNPQKVFDVREELQNRQAKAKESAMKEREEEQGKQKVLEAAFASSDEDEGSNISSEWEEEDALFSGEEEDQLVKIK